ncbi:MAG: alpha/beta hydrolase [Granulosicoccus sp.]
MNTLIKFFSLIVVCYAGFLAVLYGYQRQLLYFPPADYYSPQQLNEEGIEEILLTTSDGTRLTAWWSPPEIDGQPVVMFFHGNASAVYGYRVVYEAIREAGFGVWAVSYPGYPGAGGKPGQEAMVNASIAQYDYLSGQNIGADQIAFYGTSLGAGVAIQLTKHRKPALLIAEAPFNSALDMAQRSFPIVPVSWLLKDQYRSDVAMQTYDGPLLWLHGTDDSVIPIEQGQTLYDSYSGEKRSLILQGGGHNNVWESGGAEVILQELLEMSASGGS